MFEWVYFAGAESSILDQSVYAVRLKLGQALADQIKCSIDVGEIAVDLVCPVPDTSRTAAIALSERLGLPYREGLIKNRYIQRSFITEGSRQRDAILDLKLSPVVSEIANKNVLLVDDSIVRGATSKKIVELLRRSGVKKVTIAVTCPPLRYPCFYGIDFPQAESLVAHQRSNQQIADWIGADKVVYLTEEYLTLAIGTSNLCKACVNGKYPTSVSHAEEFVKYR